MSQFKVVITVPGNKLVKLLEQLNGHKVYVESEHVTEAGSKFVPVARLNSTDIVLLHETEKATSPLHNTLVDELQKLEKKKGIGTVTRAMLTEALAEYSDAPGAVINAAKKRGIIRGVKHG